MTGTNLLNSQTVAIKFVGSDPCYRRSSRSANISSLKSRRSRGSLMRLSCGTSTDRTRSCPVVVCPDIPHSFPCLDVCRSLIPVAASSALSPHDSWNPSSILLWTRRSSQHPGDRPLGSFHGRPLRHVWAKVLGQDLCHGSQADGELNTRALRNTIEPHSHPCLLICLIDYQG